MTEEKSEEKKEEETAGKGIPDFWLSALRSHPMLAEMITEEDEEALKHLQNISVKYHDDLIVILFFCPRRRKGY